MLNWLHSKNITISRPYPNLPDVHNIIICHASGKVYDWVKENYDIDHYDENGNTPLHISCHQDTLHNSLEACEWLCKNGANVNAINKDGNTALHISAMSGFSNCIKLLLDAGCDKNILNKKGKTALDIVKSLKDLPNNNKWEGDFAESYDFLTKSN